LNTNLISTHFNGSCLADEDRDKIISVACEATFEQIAIQFGGYSKKLDKEKFPPVISK